MEKLSPIERVKKAFNEILIFLFFLNGALLICWLDGSFEELAYLEFSSAQLFIYSNLYSTPIYFLFSYINKPKLELKIFIFMIFLLVVIGMPFNFKISLIGITTITFIMRRLIRYFYPHN
jgi:hypothetical protein